MSLTPLYPFIGGISDSVIIYDNPCHTHAMFIYQNIGNTVR